MLPLLNDILTSTSIPDTPVPVSYNTLSAVEQATEYFQTRLYSEIWFALDIDHQSKALAQATRIINQLAYIGWRTDPTQPNAWPRSGILLDGQALDPTIIPDDILNGQYEIAFALAKGYDPERDIRTSMITSRGYSSVRVAYDPKQIPQFLKLGIPSLAAWNFLWPYLDTEDAGLIELHRVS